MIRRYIDAGFGHVVATPHIELPAAISPLTVHREALELIQPFATNAGLELSQAAEIRLTPEIRDAQDEIAAFTLGASRYLLVDFPSGSWPFYAEESLFQVRLSGYTPILAHPERYGWQSGDLEMARLLVDRGVMIQVTLGSFVGAFGSAPSKLAISLLEQGLVHLVATDAHGAKGRMDAAIASMDWLRTTYGESTLTTLLADNPAAVLKGEPIVPVTVTSNWRTRFPNFPRFIVNRR